MRFPVSTRARRRPPYPRQGGPDVPVLLDACSQDAIGDSSSAVLKIGSKDRCRQSPLCVASRAIKTVKATDSDSNRHLTRRLSDLRGDLHRCAGKNGEGSCTFALPPQPEDEVFQRIPQR